LSIGSASDRPALELYGTELLRASLRQSGPGALRLVDHAGEELPLEIGRYVGVPGREDSGVLRRAQAPVLDVGCGPARHALALGRSGVMAVGVDISPLAVQLARRRGATVIEASVFDPLPLEGAWGSALLLDGNIGIGGCPESLLARVADLVRPGGLILVELEAPHVATGSVQVRLETSAARSHPFAWARVGFDDLLAVAAGAGCEVSERWRGGERWFAALTRGTPAQDL
jgi:SAM-dependent methyltransferase